MAYQPSSRNEHCRALELTIADRDDNRFTTQQTALALACIKIVDFIVCYGSFKTVKSVKVRAIAKMSDFKPWERDS